jgi:hypothetical protein
MKAQTSVAALTLHDVHMVPGAWLGLPPARIGSLMMPWRDTACQKPSRKCGNKRQPHALTISGQSCKQYPVETGFIRP